jgi:thiosulfate/3-mercaptopyruvate sulfurtransferase
MKLTHLTPNKALSRRSILLASAALGLTAQTSWATLQATPEADSWAHPEWFIAPDGLTEADYHIVMFGTAKEYLNGRIDMADHLDWPDLDLMQSDPESVATWAEQTKHVLLGHGINLDNLVAVVDYGTLFATRVFWVMTYLGATQQVILNGGLPVWQQAGGEVLTGPVFIDYGPIPEANPTRNEAVLAPIDTVAQAVASGSAQFIDARTAEEFAEGHIPGAINIAYLENSVDSSGGVFRSPSDLRELYAAAGVDLNEPIIPYCSTGVRSAATWFTLTALGAPNVSLFSGSWREWITDPARPIET